MLSGVATARPIVEAKGIHKHFGALHVLKGVDLTVGERELVFVIGPSGSGKSTLLRCCNRLETPSSGSVVVDGIDLLDRRTDINLARRRIEPGLLVSLVGDVGPGMMGVGGEMEAIGVGLEEPREVRL